MGASCATIHGYIFEVFYIDIKHENNKSIHRWRTGFREGSSVSWSCFKEVVVYVHNLFLILKKKVDSRDCQRGESPFYLKPRRFEHI